MDTQQILHENALLKEQILLKDEPLFLKDEQLFLKDKQLLRKNERILYLVRQLFGRRSEKKLPDYNEAQLSLFDPEQGNAVLEQEALVLTTLAEDIKQKAEQRRSMQKAGLVSGKRSYKIPLHIERRETILNPENVNPDTLVKIGEDVSERLMLEPSRFWVERTVRPVYKVKQDEQSLSATIVQAPSKPVILPGCIAGESLLSQIIVDKFLYHLPEYRQAKTFQRTGSRNKHFEH